MLLGSARRRTIGRQIGSALLTLFLISIVTFGMMSVRTPDQVAREKFGNQVTTEQVAAFSHQYGLDKPVYVRYGKWLWRFAHGDMGTSYVTGVPVSTNVLPRFKRTLILSIVSLLIAFPISVELGWLPVDSATALTFASSFGEQAKAYVLPAATLVLAIVPYIARIARGSLREALGMPYTQAAVLRGLSRRTVIWDHAMRNAGVPLVNAVAINIVYLLSGVIVVEWVFAFPGIGQGLVQATSTSDAFNVEAIALVMGAMFIGVSVAADLTVAYLNPRLKAAAGR